MRLHVREAGRLAGADLCALAIHGWGEDGSAFDALIPHLPPGVRLAALDLPGCGLSPALRPLSVEGLAQAIAEAAEAQGEPRLLVLGNCAGGIHALLAQSRMRRRPAEIVLLDPLAALPGYFALLLAPVVGPLCYYAAFANPLGRWAVNLALSGSRVRGTNMLEDFAHCDHRTTREYLRHYAGLGTPEQFRGCAAPVRIIHGDRTFAAVTAGLPRWREVLPLARIQQLPAAGHLPLLDNPGGLARLLFDGSPGAVAAEQRIPAGML